MLWKRPYGQFASRSPHSKKQRYWTVHDWWLCIFKGKKLQKPQVDDLWLGSVISISVSVIPGAESGGKHWEWEALNICTLPVKTSEYFLIFLPNSTGKRRHFCLATFIENVKLWRLNNDKLFKGLENRVEFRVKLARCIQFRLICKAA